MDALFALGLVGPLLLLVGGFVVIGLAFSIIVFVIRRRSRDESIANTNGRKVDWATALLASAALLPIVAGILSSLGSHGAGFTLLCFVCFLLWPVSAVFTLLGKGTGRGLLLMAHGLIVLWSTAILLLIWIHGV